MQMYYHVTYTTLRRRMKAQRIQEIRIIPGANMNESLFPRVAFAASLAVEPEGSLNGRRV